MTAAVAAEKCRVRVWFGEHLITGLRAEPALANRHAAAVEGRFPSLRVTVDPVPRPDANGRRESS